MRPIYRIWISPFTGQIERLQTTQIIGGFKLAFRVFTLNGPKRGWRGEKAAHVMF